MKKIYLSIIFIVALLSTVYAQYFVVNDSWIRTTTYYMKMDMGQYHDEWKETCEFMFYLNTKKYHCKRDLNLFEGIIVEIVKNSNEEIIIKGRDHEGRPIKFIIDLEKNIVHETLTGQEENGSIFYVEITYLVDK